MNRTDNNSRLEIWTSKYINDIDSRKLIDKNAIVIQIEPTQTNNGDYMVEIIGKKERR